MLDTVLPSVVHSDDLLVLDTVLPSEVHSDYLLVLDTTVGHISDIF